MKTIKSILLTLLLATNILACSDIQGIEVNDTTLYMNRSFFEKQELKKLITQSVNHDEQAFKALVNFDCGGGAGCYDLGGIITEILYLVGEDEFIKMTQALSVEEKRKFCSLLEFGFEYGKHRTDDPDLLGHIQQEFPKLYKQCYVGIKR